VMEFPSDVKIIVVVNEVEVGIGIGKDVPFPIVKKHSSPYVEIEIGKNRYSCLYSNAGRIIVDLCRKENESVETAVVIVSSTALRILQNGDYEEYGKERIRLFFVTPDTSSASVIRDEEGKIIGVKRFVVS